MRPRLNLLAIMLFLSPLATIAIVASVASAELDVSEIFKFEVCQGKRATISEDELERLKNEKGEFPRWGYSLGPALAEIDKYNQSPQKCLAFAPGSKAPNAALVALAEVTRRTAGLLTNDLRAQRGLIKSGHVCTSLLLNAAKQSGNPLADPIAINSGPEIFASQAGRSPSPQQCHQFISKFVPELKNRFTRMRQFLALKNGVSTPNQPLKHDIPYTKFLTEKFLGSVWKSSETVEGLSASEIDGMAALTKNSKLPPEDLYYQTISTAPILLFFSKSIDASSLEKAFDGLEKQASRDLAEIEKDPSQEMLLYTSYVLEAIKALPENQKGDACLAVKSIYKNLVVRYQTIPTGLSIAALLISIPNPELWVASGGSKAFIAAFLERAGLATFGTKSVAAIDNAILYRRSVAMCSSIAMQSNEAPEIDGACSMQRTNQRYLDAETDLAVGAFFGGAAFGIGKLVRKFSK